MEKIIIIIACIPAAVYLFRRVIPSGKGGCACGECGACCLCSEEKNKEKRTDLN